MRTKKKAKAPDVIHCIVCDGGSQDSHGAYTVCVLHVDFELPAAA